MEQLPDKLSNEQVEKLAEAGRVQYEPFLTSKKYFAIIDENNLYANRGSYTIITREYKKRVDEIINRKNN